MKYYIISGEASGDLHGANLIRSLKKEDAEADIRCWGGDLMSEAGGKVVMHYEKLAFMGFVEVISNLGKIKKNFSFCKEDVLGYNPDVVVLIDYPGFNLRMAKFFHEKNVKVFYYISPQVWAWNRSRVKKIKKFVDRMFVILPFEKDFYKQYGMEVDFVGHPLLDAIKGGMLTDEKTDFRKEHGLDERDIIAVLPGSRKQEISRMLPVMLKIVSDFPDYQFVLAGAPSISAEYYAPFLQSGNTAVVYNKTYDLLENSKAAMVTSGTATLETALFKVPEVVCYSGNFISYLLARALIKVKYISLVNLIMNKEIVKELIQSDFNEVRLKMELNQLLSEGPYRNTMLKNLEELAEKLGGQGASYRAASLMIRYLGK